MTTAVHMPSSKEIANFGWMETWLARGADPQPAGYRWLADRGFKVLVSLRSQSRSRTVARLAGEVEPIHIPVKDNRPPSHEQALQWLELCSMPSMRPLFVHCNAGQGRTSTFCALVRIAQGWELKDAIEEQLAFGFAPAGAHQEQARFLQRFVQKGIPDGVQILV